MSEEKPVVLKPGDDAPHFVLPSDRGEDVDLKAFHGKKNVVLYFYPKDSTPGCTTEACDFRDTTAVLEKLDTVVLGVSKDSVASHKRFVEKQQLNFPLLSDTEGRICEAYGVYQLKKNYGREYMGIVRSTFIIGKDGKIIEALYGVKVKGHADHVLSSIQAI
ncbi:MAG: thioredoxin-dependent thiol peroxidase [Nitrospiria bacterium]